MNNPVVMKDADHLAIWAYILLNAAFDVHDTMLSGKRITLKAGQFVTGRKAISQQLRVSESKVERVLSCFENEQMIEQQKTTKGRLITVLNWQLYQDTEQQTEQQVDNKWTTSEQQVNTTKEIKNVKKERNNNNIVRFTRPTVEEVRAYCEERGNSVDADRFVAYYDSNGWKVGKNAMKDWRAAVRTWERSGYNNSRKDVSNNDSGEYADIYEQYRV